MMHKPYCVAHVRTLVAENIGFHKMMMIASVPGYTLGSFSGDVGGVRHVAYPPDCLTLLLCCSAAHARDVAFLNSVLSAGEQH